MKAGGKYACLNGLLTEAGLEPLDEQTASRVCDYVSLFLRWNARLNLSAIRDENGVISRHIIESIKFAREVPPVVSTLLDFGSGAGLPGIPIALCRPRIAVTLSESRGKKAAFLREAVRVLGIPAIIHAQRAETLRAVFDCVVLRAVDRMPQAIAIAAKLVGPKGYLGLMTTDEALPRLQSAAGAQFSWEDPVRMTCGSSRLISLGQKRSSKA